MKLKYLFITLMCFLSVFPTVGRELKVENFEMTANDLSARAAQVKDLNGDVCALVRVILPIEGCKFEGNVIKQEFDINEYRVFMVKGSKRLRLKCPGMETLDIELTNDEGEGVVEGMTYSVKLSGYDDLIQNRPQAADPGANYLILEITPKTGVSVKVDDVTQSVDNGETMTFLKYGTHKWSVDAEGYASAEGTAEINRSSNTVIQVKLESIMSHLNIKTLTDGATIKINGKESGKGSYSGTVAPGIYQIEVSKDNYRPHSTTVEIGQRQEKEIVIPELEPIYGVLNIAYKPIGATVKIDGIEVGTTPNVFRNIITGKHEVEISKNGYYSIMSSVNVKDGETAMLRGELEAIPDDIQIIMNLLDEYKSCYDNKNLYGLESLFSDDALIVRANVNKILSHQVKFVLKPLRSYFDEIEQTFNRYSWINFSFDNLLITRSEKVSTLYEVSFKQTINFNTGYVLLLVDLKDTTKPNIIAHAWEPITEETAKNRLNINDFEISKDKIKLKLKQ